MSSTYGQTRYPTPVSRAQHEGGRLLPGLVLLFGLGITAAWWAFSEYELRRAESQRFEAAAYDVMNRLQDRLAAFEQALRGVAVLKGSSPQSGDYGWSMYVERLQLMQRFPGLVGVAFSEKVMPEELDGHEAAQHLYGQSQYKVHPVGVRTVYYPLVHIAPHADAVVRRLGFDGHTDPVRRLAMERALRTSEPAYTGPVTLFTDNPSDGQPGFVVYLPVYGFGAKAVAGQPDLGFVSGGFRISQLLESVLGGRNDLELSMFTESVAIASGLADRSSQSGRSITRSFTRGGQAWSLRVTARPTFDFGRAPSNGLKVPLIGLVLSVVMCFATFRIDRNRRNAEAQLVSARDQTEQKFRELSGSVPFIMWMTDREFDATFLNERWTEFTGQPVKEALGKGWGAKVHSDDIEGMVSTLSECAKRGETLDVEFRLRRKDGEYRWMLSQGEPTRGIDGDVIRYAGTCVDVTERRAIAEKARQSQEEFRLAVEASGTGVWHVDLVANRCVVSSRFLDMLGISMPQGSLSDGNVYIVEDFMNSDFAKRFDELLHPDDLVVRTAAMQALLRDRVLLRVQLRFRNDAGQYRWFNFHGDAEWNDDGKVTRHFGAVVDITDRKLAEETLEESRAFIAEVFNAVPVPLYVKNQNHEWLVLNDACFALNGVAREQMIGKTDFDFHPPERAARYAAQDDAVFASTEALVVEEPYAEQNGTVRWIQKSKKAITTRKGERVIVGANIDVTERKRAERNAEEGRDFLVAILNAIPNPIFVKDSDHRFMLVNNAFAELLNARADTVIGKTDADYFAPEVVTVRVAEDKQVMAAGHPVSFEVLLGSPDGRTRWTLKSKAPFRTRENSLGIVGIVTDISDLKTAETERRNAALEVERSKAFLEAIIDAIPAQVYVKDAAHRFVMVNNRMLQWVGGAREQVIGKTDAEFVTPELAEKIWREDGKAIESFEPVVFETFAGSQVSAPLWWHKTKRSVRLPSGETGLVGINIDITSRKRTEDTARASSQRLHLLNQLSTGSIAELSIEEMIKLAVDGLAPVVGAKACYGLLKGDEVVIIYPTALEARRSSRELVTYDLSTAPDHRKTLHEGRFVTVSDVTLNPATASWRRTLKSAACRSLLSMPIRLHGVLHATLNLYDGEAREWSSDHIEAAMEVADALAVALQNEQSRKERQRADNALRESEAFLHAVVDAIPLPVFVKDELHRYLLINASGAEWLGWDRHALLGQSDFEIYDDAVAQRHWNEDDQVFAGNPVEAEVALAKGLSETRWVIKRKEAASLPNGKRAVVVCMTDITARKQSEDVIIAARARLQLVNELTAEIIAGETFAQIAKSTVTRLGSHFPDKRVVYSEIGFEQSKVVEQASDVAQFATVTGEMCRGPRILAHINRLRTASGSIIDNACAEMELARARTIDPVGAEFAFVDMPVFERGELCGLLSVDARDAHGWTENELAMISAAGDVLTLALQKHDEQAKRLKVEAALRESESTLQAAVWAADVGLWSLDLVGNKPNWSTQAKKQLGYEDHEIADDVEIWSTLTHPDDRERAIHELAASIKSRSELFESEFRLRRKDGDWANVLVRARIERDSRGWATRLVGGNIDVTEFRKTQETLRRHSEELEMLVAERTHELVGAKEAAESANTAKSEFLANMSHELRTPMHAILSFAQMGFGKAADDSISRDKLKQYFERIDTSGERLLVLLNALLDLSKLESGKMNYDLREYDFGHIIDSAVEELRTLGNDRGVAIHIVKDREVSSIECDALRIGQVMRNLLSNAIKFTPSGKSITIRLRDDQIEDTSNAQTLPAVHVTVVDEGVGIPENELEAVFDKFVQSSKTKDGSGGTGLGLPISREIVTHHNGQIWASNTAQGGAEFHVLLPVRVAPTHSSQEIDQQGRYAA